MSVTSTEDLISKLKRRAYMPRPPGRSEHQESCVRSDSELEPLFFEDLADELQLTASANRPRPSFSSAKRAG